MLITNDRNRNENREEKNEDIERNYVHRRSSLPNLNELIPKIQIDVANPSDNVMKEKEDNQTLVRTNSLDTGLSIYQNKKKNSEKINSFNIDEPSLATIVYKDEITGEEKIEAHAIVPPRDVLIKMPFHSTPLGIESTNYAFPDGKQHSYDMDINEETRYEDVEDDEDEQDENEDDQEDGEENEEAEAALESRSAELPSYLKQLPNNELFAQGLNFLPPPPRGLSFKKNHALANMLLSWYWRGFHEGYEAAIKHK